MTTRMKRLFIVVALVGIGIGVVDSATADTVAQVTAGYGHACALTTSGGVKCWGTNYFGELGDGTFTPRRTPTAVTGLQSGVVDIAAGDSHTCALKADGSVYCWGWNVSGQLGDGTTAIRTTPTPVIGPGNVFAALDAGGAHTCAVTMTGALMCWGHNGDGALGDGTTTNRLVPTAVVGLDSGVATASAGSGYTCVVTTSGGVKCWGLNTSGQVGDGTTTRRTTPTAVSGLANGVSDVMTGAAHACALLTSGSVECWGYNFYGQLGDGTTTARLAPTPVAGIGGGVSRIGAGRSHSCAAFSGGGVKCWGYNWYGQLGDGTYSQSRLTPVPIVGPEVSVASLAAGYGHTCALTTGGSVLCWGWNDSGQLADGTTVARATATGVGGVTGGTTTPATGESFTCAITADAVKCWGENYNGQLGNGTTVPRATPWDTVALGGGVASLAAGGSHACVVLTGGEAKCWGYNADRQVGDGTTTDRPVPTSVTGLGSGVAGIAAGFLHSCAVTVGGAVKCWGSNYRGQLGDGTTAARTVPVAVSGLASGVASVAAGNGHSCALSVTGAVTCWGANDYGQLGDGTATQRLTPTAVRGLASGVVAIAVAGVHSCALTSGGGVKCWGRNALGELGDGARTDRRVPTDVSGLGTGVAAIAAGSNSQIEGHTCALMTDGVVKCWGANIKGQLGDGTTGFRLVPTPVIGLGSNVTTIAAGGSHTCAALAGGSLACWGDDSLGQLGQGTRWASATPVSAYGFGGSIVADAVDPTSGSSRGGTTIALAGAYFLQGATVTVGGVPATGVSVVNTETIIATAGPHAPGVVDIVVTNPDGTTATLAGAFTYESSAVASDMGGDGKSDILWHHAGRGEVWLWGMDGASRTAQTHVRTVGEPGWEIRGVSDFTGDGKADLLWRNSLSGLLYLWTMNGSVITAETYVGTVDPAYDIVTTGDYNGDGKADLLWRQTASGEVWLWQLNGPVVVSQTYIDTVDPNYVVQGSGDLNGDGKSDLMWRGSTGGDVWVWLMNGATPTVSYADTVAELDYRIVGIGDLTGDGKADLVWHHATRGEVWLWTMNGATATAQTYVDTVPDTDYRIVGTGDYNGDGKADLLWHHATRGEVWTWLMNGTSRLSANYVDTVPDTGYRITR